MAKSHLPVAGVCARGAFPAAKTHGFCRFYDCLKKTRVFFKQFSPAERPPIDTSTRVMFPARRLQCRAYPVRALPLWHPRRKPAAIKQRHVRIAVKSEGAGSLHPPNRKGSAPPLALQVLDSPPLLSMPFGLKPHAAHEPSSGTCHAPKNRRSAAFPTPAAFPSTPRERINRLRGGKAAICRKR